jgi:single-stranded-DNA-specific exonuclease
MSQAPRTGLRALLEVSALAGRTLNAYDIGFSIGPRINAAGRLDSAMLAYDLLMSDSLSAAHDVAERLNHLNTERQRLTRLMQEQARSGVESPDAPLIFASDHDFKSGIVGLVAGKLTEEFYRPVVVMELGETESRASCRSIREFDITHALDECAELLVRHGGHAQAAGFTVVNENIPALKQRLTAIAERQLSGQDLRPALDIDAEVPPEQLTMRLAEDLRALEPTGNGNPPPILMTRALKVTDRRTMGREQQHIRLKLLSESGQTLEAVGFNMAELQTTLPVYIDVAYELDINEYNDKRTLQLRLRDARPAQTLRGS